MEKKFITRILVVMKNGGNTILTERKLVAKILKEEKVGENTIPMEM